ncbi:MAG: hypothetical protein ACLFN0_03085 [Thermovirgaceae bacterium]
MKKIRVLEGHPLRTGSVVDAREANRGKILRRVEVLDEEGSAARYAFVQPMLTKLH